MATTSFGVTQLSAQTATTPAPGTTTTPTTTPTYSATPTPTTPTPAIAARALGSRVLRPGARGADVKELQRILRRRGHKISVDGGYGPRTAAAVTRLQRNLGLRASGNCDWPTMRKLGIRRVRSVTPATTPAPAAPVGATNYPLAGPNAAAAKYLKVFPVAGKHTYSNDFGAARSQGGHQGNDIMAAKGIPVRAVANGVVTRANRAESGLGGVYVWMSDAAGNDYYFAHLDSIADGIVAGTRVTAGQVLGGVGNTGDARYGATHLHFEIRPNGSAPINPYTDLLAVDPEPPVRK